MGGGEGVYEGGVVLLRVQAGVARVGDQVGRRDRNALAVQSVLLVAPERRVVAEPDLPDLALWHALLQQGARGGQDGIEADEVRHGRAGGDDHTARADGDGLGADGDRLAALRDLSNGRVEVQLIAELRGDTFGHLLSAAAGSRLLRFAGAGTDGVHELSL